MRYATFFYINSNRTNPAFDEFHESLEKVEEYIQKSYDTWVHDGGDKCGLDEWRKDFVIYEIVNISS